MCMIDFQSVAVIRQVIFEQNPSPLQWNWTLTKKNKPLTMIMVDAYVYVIACINDNGKYFRILF